MLDERARQVLIAVIECYTNSLAPVGSRLITKRFAFGLSPATIRNIMADLEEMRAAVEGVRQISGEIPIIMTMTFDTHGRTMMGVTPEKAVAALNGYGAVAVGGNCGNGPEEIIAVVEKMQASSPGTTLVAKANAGKYAEALAILDAALPSITDEKMAEEAKKFRAEIAQRKKK